MLVDGGEAKSPVSTGSGTNPLEVLTGYAWAGYESLDAAFNKSYGSLKVKVRTLLVGTGLQDSDAHFDGYLACKTLPELRKWIEEKEFDDDFGDDA